MEHHYRRLARKFYRMLRHPKKLRASSAHRWLGSRVFDRRLWVPERHAFVNGLAAGMFFSMLPPFTPQMPITAVFNIWRKWNIPIGLAACWVSNVFTLVPQIYLQIKLGLWTVGLFVPEAGKAGRAFARLEEIFQIWHSDGWKAALVAFQPQAVQILTPLTLPYSIGIILSGIILSAGSYVLGHALWSVFAHRVPVKHTVPHRPPGGAGSGKT
jgi:uncharacterized protein (DUF2062 family)